MPPKVQKRGNKYRVVDPNGKLLRNRAGTPVDGGGHKTKAEAQDQASAIILSQGRKK